MTLTLFLAWLEALLPSKAAPPTVWDVIGDDQ